MIVKKKFRRPRKIKKAMRRNNCKRVIRCLNLLLKSKLLIHGYLDAENIVKNDNP